MVVKHQLPEFKKAGGSPSIIDQYPESDNWWWLTKATGFTRHVTLINRDSLIPI